MKLNGISPMIHEELFSSLDIQEWNLKTFSREIYENIGQILGLAKFQIATLNPEKEEARQIVKQSDQLLNSVIKDLRGLAKQLTPTEIMHKGFAASLSYELERLNSMGLCKTTFIFKGNAFRLNEIRELILFSIIQHYILKAFYIENARQMHVTVSYTKHMISISIYFPVNSDLNPGLKIKKGFGIIKRAGLIGAVIKSNRTRGHKNISIRIKK